MIVTELKVEFINGTQRVRLTDDFFVYLPRRLDTTIKSGFETDLASVPRLFWPLMSPFGDLRYGAVIHDFGYQHGYLLAEYSPSVVYERDSKRLRRAFPEFGAYVPICIRKDRKFFDELLRDITLYATQSKVQAWLAYFAVRLFGWRAWNKYRRLGPAAFNSNSLQLPGV